MKLATSVLLLRLRLRPDTGWSIIVYLTLLILVDTL